MICGKTISVYYKDTCQTSKSFKEDTSSKVKSSHLFHFSKFLTYICTLVQKEKEREKNYFKNSSEIRSECRNIGG